MVQFKQKIYILFIYCFFLFIIFLTIYTEKKLYNKLNIIIEEDANTIVNTDSLNDKNSNDNNILNGGNINIPDKPMIIIVTSAILIGLNGIDNLITIKTPTNAVKYTAIVEILVFSIPKNPPINVANTTFSIMFNPPGIAREITFAKKSPLILSWFGCKAKTNDGNPIVSAPTKDNCIGWNG